jgi:hypothetical protein
MAARRRCKGRVINPTCHGQNRQARQPQRIRRRFTGVGNIVGGCFKKKPYDIKPRFDWVLFAMVRGYGRVDHYLALWACCSNFRTNSESELPSATGGVANKLEDDLGNFGRMM